ncbi:MAG: transcriptional repressor [Brotaphodocola sp.]
MTPQKKHVTPGIEIKNQDCQQYCASSLEKDIILKRLSENGGRITKQRELLIDIILKKEFANCKEIYYDAVKFIPDIGMATIYRTVNALEEVGALRKNNISCMKKKSVRAEECLIQLEDDTTIRLDARSLNHVIERGMEESGLLKGKRVRNVLVEKGGLKAIE